MEVKILGQGCAKCKKMYEHVMKAKEALDVDADVIKVENLSEIVKYGVMMTPALVINGEVKVVGKVPTVDEIKNLIK